MTQDELDAMLRWLDPVVEKAGEKLNHIRAAITKMLVSRGCFEAEEGADETIDRVAKKVKDIAPGYVGDPSKYFYGFAKNVLHECLSKQRRLIPIIPEPDPFPEQKVQCLEGCLEEFPPDVQHKMMEYHRFDGREKIKHRNWLAKHYGLSLTALRIQVHRITKRLEPCIVGCLQEKEKDLIS